MYHKIQEVVSESPEDMSIYIHARIARHNFGKVLF